MSVCSIRTCISNLNRTVTMIFTSFQCYRLLLLCYCAVQVTYSSYLTYSYLPEYRFQIEYGWSHLNYTWVSPQRYSRAVASGEYIPENNVPTGLKIYNGNLYMSMPKFRKGVPVTIVYIPMSSAKKKNELLVPYPSWEMNDATSCTNLQSVQSMEIDANGIMWVLDGVRIGNNINCPPKLVFLDLNNSGFLVYSYIFPNEISLQNGGFLNDIVIDDADGGYAYITDNSNIDPGLIVYSRKKNRSWKLRDRSMFPEPWAVNFVVENKPFEALVPIDGIALSPKPSNDVDNRTVFYSSLTGLDIHAISTAVLKDEELSKSDRWRINVKYLGPKESQSDGMIMDSRGNLYYTLLPLYGVGRWNVWDQFGSSEIIDINRDTIVWPDGFAMDQRGYLYLISNYVFNYINPNVTLKLTPDIKFRVFKLYTGTKSYLYSYND